MRKVVLLTAAIILFAATFTLAEAQEDKPPGLLAGKLDVTFGIATNFKLNDRLSFVPGLYYQESMDDSVCKRDVIYCKLSLKYRF